MLVTDDNVKNIFLHVLKSLKRRDIEFNNDYKIAVSNDQKHIALYVSYVEHSLVVANKTVYKIFVLRLVNNETNSYEICHSFNIREKVIVSGLDINSDGTKVFAGITNIYPGHNIVNEEFVRIWSFDRGLMSHKDIGSIHNNNFFGYNILSANIQKHDLLFISSPLGNSGVGEYFIYRLNLKGEYVEVIYNKEHFDSLLKLNGPANQNRMFGITINDLHHLAIIIELHHSLMVEKEQLIITA